jgi:HlyD family secretion protein
MRALLLALAAFATVAALANYPLVQAQAARLQGYFGLPAQDAAADAMRYLTEPVIEGNLEQTITATGTLNATVNVEVGSQLSGQVTEVFVDFDDAVVKGQPLSQLDQRSFRARLAEAEAELNAAKVGVGASIAKLERARIGVQDSEAQRAVFRARTESALARLKAAESELWRKDSLRERGAGSAAAQEDASTRLAVAKAALREAEALEAAHENTVKSAVADQRRVQSELEEVLASVPQKKAAMLVRQIDFERTVIRSPVDGVIVGRNVNPGQTLATTLEAKPLFIVAGDLRRMEIHAKVDEADIGKIRVGQPATFTVDAHPGQRFPAAVRQIRKAPQPQQNVVTYTVVLSTDNEDRLLLPGMTASAKITINSMQAVLKLPLAALHYAPTDGYATPAPEVARGKPASVWVAGKDGRPQPVTVGLGEEDGSYAVVVSGALTEGDRVIVGEAAGPPAKRLFGIRIGL